MFSLLQRVFGYRNSKQTIIPKWNDEIDFLEWEDMGLKCTIERNKVFGIWCGYVGVPKSHSYFGLSIDDSKTDDLDVHGGITYSGVRAGLDPDFHWFGFDCGHVGDFAPNVDNARVAEIMKKNGVSKEYRDIEYAIYNTVKLCIDLSWK